MSIEIISVSQYEGNLKEVCDAWSIQSPGGSSVMVLRSMLKSREGYLALDGNRVRGVRLRGISAVSPWDKMNNRGMEVRKALEGTKSMKSREKALQLSIAGMRLWSTLYKAEEDAELGQSSQSAEGITDLPTVPNQEAYTSREKATHVVDQISGLLQQVLTDEDIRDELSPEEREQVRQVSHWLKDGLHSLTDPKSTKNLGFQAMKSAEQLDVRLSVKAIIRTPDGHTLVLKDAYSEYWDLPGGHVQDGETLSDALQREVYEETGLTIKGMKEREVRVLTLGAETKPVVFYDVVAEGEIQISEEHHGYLWGVDAELDALNLGVFKEILFSKSILQPSGEQVAAERPAQENIENAVGQGDDLTNPSYEAALPESVDPQQAAISSIQWHHGDPVEIEEIKEDGDAVVACSTHEKRWYVTRAGEVFTEGLHKGIPPAHNKEDALLGDHPSDYASMGTTKEMGPAIPGLEADNMTVDSFRDDPSADRVEVEKEGDGGIAGAGDSMAGVDVHTPVGGSHQRREDKSLPIITRMTGVSLMDSPTVTDKLQKAVTGDPSRYDLRVISKQYTGKTKTSKKSKRFIVAGYASPVMIDLEGHKITLEALERDLPRFMADGGAYANVNIMHSNVTVGRILPEYTDERGVTVQTRVDDVGLFVVAEIRTDTAAPTVCSQVIEDIISGKLRSFSISGNADLPRFTCDEEQCFYSVDDLQLYEITICEEGVNPEAKFDVIAKSKMEATEFAGLKMIHRKLIKQKGKATDSVNEADLLKYFGAFKALFTMYHKTGALEVVLYDRDTGEILLPDDEIELE